MSVVNWAETLSKVAADGDDPQTVATRLRRHVHPRTTHRRRLHRNRSASPSHKAPRTLPRDRACLALGARLGIPVLTADRDWADLNIGITVQLIR